MQNQQEYLGEQLEAENSEFHGLSRADVTTLISDLASHLRLMGGSIPEVKSVNSRFNISNYEHFDGNSGAGLVGAVPVELACAMLPAGIPSSASSATSISAPSIEERWALLEQDALACRKCRLCEGRTNVVFGVGLHTRPPIVFVGEGPGAEEDAQGEPFVGKSGQLLTRAIENGIGLQRSQVYICNVVKCRPPENRAPLPDEAITCFPYLEEQLRLLEPRVIVALGAVALKALIGEGKGGITALRGKWMDWHGTPLLATFHPAYLLRTPSAKSTFWEDLKLVMAHLGIERRSTK